MNLNRLGTSCTALLMCLSSTVSLAGNIESVLCRHRNKVAVIGAGVSGLTAAKTLKRKGYENVVVFEKEAKVGGKIQSFDYQGSRYDLGAVLVTTAFRGIIEEAKALDIAMVEFKQDFQVVYDNRKETLGQYLASNYSEEQINQALLKFAQLTLTNPKIGGQGHAWTSKDLALPMSEYLQQHPELAPLVDTVRPFYVGYGYGFYEETPAIYYMKLIHFYFIDNLRVRLSELVKGEYESTSYYFENGYQAFWEAFAADLDVRLNAPVSAVERRKVGLCTDVFVTANGKTERFDKVIVATPLKAAEAFLDLSSDEQELLSMVDTYNYYTVLHESDFLPPDATFFYRDNQSLDRLGSVLVATRYSGGPAQTLYLQAPKGASPEFIEQQVRSHIEAEGGSLRKIVLSKHWDYFPHVKSSDDQSFFNRMEAMQGKNGTYFISSVMNLETVEQSYLYAKKTIRKFF